MRSSKSRSRSKANRPRSLGNIINRVFDSSGPEGKVRGTPQQIIEKYLILARDAQLSNDRVAAENFLQHAEHYTRLLGEAQRELAAEQEERQRLHQQNQGQNGNREGAPNGGNRDGWRDRDDRRDWRGGDRPEGQGDAGVEVIETEGEDDNLVETPEARPYGQQARRDDRDGNRDSNRDRRDPAGQAGGRPHRGDRREGGQNFRRDDRRDEDRPARDEAAPVSADDDVAARDLAAREAPQEAVEKPAKEGGRKPAAGTAKPRSPRKPKAEKPEGGEGEGGGGQAAAE